MRKPNPQFKDKRREQIITAAAKLFAQHNFHEVLMCDVAGQVGIAKGTLYNYFSNKEDLYISIITHRLDLLLSLLKERFDLRQNSLINIRRIIIHTYSFLAKYPHFFQMMYREKLNCDKSTHQQIHNLYQQIKDLLTLALERGVQEGILISHSVNLAADLILGIIDAAVIRSRRKPINLQREERMIVFEFVLNALGTDLAKKLHDEGQDAPQNHEEISSVIV